MLTSVIEVMLYNCGMKIVQRIAYAGIRDNSSDTPGPTWSKKCIPAYHIII